MKKFLLCASLVLATVSSSVAITGTWFGPQSAARSEKPNIVFVLTDDMRKDDLRFVPETRRLVGNRGMEFENAFVTFAMCCPSRASILTGLYPHNHRVFTNEAPEGGEPGFRHLDNSTLATWLDDAGYRTALIGKYFNGYAGTYQPPGWDVWHPGGSDTLKAQRTEDFIRASAQDTAPFSPTLPCIPPTHLPSHQHAMPIGIRTWVYPVPATTMRRASPTSPTGSGRPPECRRRGRTLQTSSTATEHAAS